MTKEIPALIKEMSIFAGRMVVWFFMIGAAICKFVGSTDDAIYVLLWAVLIQMQVYQLEK